MRGREVVAARGLEIDLAQAIAGRLGIGTLRFVQEPRFAAAVRAGSEGVRLRAGTGHHHRRARRDVDFSVP